MQLLYVALDCQIMASGRQNSELNVTHYIMMAKYDTGIETTIYYLLYYRNIMKHNDIWISGYILFMAAHAIMTYNIYSNCSARI